MYLDEASGTDASSACPIGSFYFSNSDTNPATSLGFGTWSQQAQGRFIVGVGQGTDSNSNQRTFIQGNNAGDYEVTLTEQQMPRHSHNYSSTGVDQFGGGLSGTPTVTEQLSVATSETGNDQPHNNIPPSFGMYVWLRTA